MIGRRKPYTQIGLSRVKCACGQPAKYQWNGCAIGNRWMVVCSACDIKLNDFLLRLCRIPGRAALMAAYRKRVVSE